MMQCQWFCSQSGEEGPTARDPAREGRPCKMQNPPKCVLQTDPTPVQDNHVLPVGSRGPSMLCILAWRTGEHVNAVVPFGVAGQPSTQGGHATASGLGDSADLEGSAERVPMRLYAARVVPIGRPFLARWIT
jgi:hypothetical protein